MSDNPVQVCLVDVPFNSYGATVISLSLLKAVLTRDNISSKVIYGSMMLGETTDPALYAEINSAFPQFAMAPEYIFAKAAHGDLINCTIDDYINRVDCATARHFDPAVLENIRRAVSYMIEIIPDYLDQLADKILALRPKIIGMSSMLYQNNACFALAKILKQRDPSIITVMGSANCTAESGAAICRTVADIDCTFSGEADECFGELCRLLMEYGADVPVDKLPYGAMTKKLLSFYKEKGITEYPVRRTKDLDTIPYPDYDDYFEQLKKYRLESYSRPVLMAEFSRGCWWHDTNPCSFCGLNSAGNHYRTKSPRRCLDELKYLVDRYGINRIELTDNILAPVHFKEVLPVMAAERAAGISSYQIMAEVKSNLNADEIQLLADAGICLIQPGIENLQDDILKEMNKGNRGIRHIELLKRCREAGLLLIWHMLGGFPNETEETYEELASYIPYITHLPPPMQFIHIVYDRYCTYWKNPAAYGLEIEYLPVYDAVYPYGSDFIKDTAFMYLNSRPEERGWHICVERKSPAHQKVGARINSWRETYAKNRDRLEYTPSDNDQSIELMDFRRVAEENFYSISGLAGVIFRRCIAVTRRTTLEQALTAEGYDSQEIAAALTTLIEKYKLIIEIRGELLTVALSSAMRDTPKRELVPRRLIITDRNNR